MLEVRSPNDNLNLLTTACPTVFLAGGISGCPDWQAEIIKLFDNTDFVLVNPRRSEGLATTGDGAEKQIKWEHERLKLCPSILFWFPEETLCPIVLYELGRWIACKPVYIGCHPNYKRRFDVVQQAKLEGINLIHDSLESLASYIIEHGDGYLGRDH